MRITVFLAGSLLMLSGCGNGGSPTSPGSENPVPSPKAPSGNPEQFIIAGAGDIAFTDATSQPAQGTRITGALLDRINPDIVATFGDNVNLTGTYGEFMAYFDPFWGGMRDRIRPSPGNHDYKNRLEGYFSYFTGLAGSRYYAYPAGQWLVISLDSVMLGQDIGAEVAWLKNTLRSAQAPCVLAYWHYPLFSSGKQSGDRNARLFWNELHAAGAEIVLNGHEHMYERFVPQTPSGMRDEATGIRQFIVGTGGAPLYVKTNPHPNSEVWISSHGVIRLALGAGTYSWEFITENGTLDRGTGTCH